MKLTFRQNQISGLVACGLSKKEIADKLRISNYTVENTLKTVYEKVRVSKINELTGWWLNQHYNLELNINELKKELINENKSKFNEKDGNV